jgi:RNA polymerase sigma factor (sigma-70 family)
MGHKEFGQQIQEALEQLKPAAYRLTRDSNEAKDLLQETYLKAFTQQSKFLSGSNLNAWIYTIMRNIFINNYQRLMRRKTFLDGTELQFFINSPRVENNNKNYILESLASVELKKALKNLDTNERRPFLMYFTGYKYQEIAEKLSIPLGTVKTRIYNARKILQQELGEYQFFNS